MIYLLGNIHNSLLNYSSIKFHIDFFDINVNLRFTCYNKGCSYLITMYMVLRKHVFRTYLKLFLQNVKILSLWYGCITHACVIICNNVNQQSSWCQPSTPPCCILFYFLVAEAGYTDSICITIVWFQIWDCYIFLYE